MDLKTKAKTYNKFWWFAHFWGVKRSLAVYQTKLIQLAKETSKTSDLGSINTIQSTEISKFKKEYLNKNRPVIIKGATQNWSCFKNWAPEQLKNKYGKDRVSLIDASPNFERKIDYSLKEVSFSEVLDDIQSENPKLYSRFNEMLHRHPELLEDIDSNYLMKLRHKLASGKTFQCFLGGKGSVTHLHAAAEHNLFVQVHGRKRWILFPPEYNCLLKPLVARSPYFYSAYNPLKPDFVNYPEMKDMPYYDFVLEPGDILFNPPCWWHHVLNQTMTIGFGFRWFEPITSLKSSGMQTLLTLFAKNPNVIQATLNRTNFPKIFNYLHERKK